MVDFLIGRPSVDVRAVTGSGETTLHIAARSDDDDLFALPMIQTLIDAGADVNASASSSIGHDTALQYAVQEKKASLALKLLSCGADPSLGRGPHPLTGLTLLQHCLASGSDELSREELELVRELIRKGADIESFSVSTSNIRICTDGPPLLFAAAYAQSDECVRALLEAGASVDLSLMNSRVLAESNPQPLIMVLFYYCLPYRRHVEDYTLETLVHPQDIRPIQARVEMLLKRGARVDSLGSEQSALQYACELAMDSSLELLSILLDGSTRRNVSREHMEALMMKYTPQRAEHTSSEDRKRAERQEKVSQLLSNFSARAFEGRGC